MNRPDPEAHVGIPGRRRTDRPVPLGPTHRRDWSRWGRHCVCGLRWPCPDRMLRRPGPHRQAGRR
ncbi:hypothetical protein O7628_20905 [Micromonospora sp. WMMD956]|uniref:hypothetical protein n=1 Tax=Micromonospora sp. WMMD956 TaxID=3016108 RepID=UPI002416CCC9|nr:hypothetical protein [Micromonospora sp. WMMD956]MDG4817952.1 hypothetical protein [Micromonospora sp. WMMD956]